MVPSASTANTAGEPVDTVIDLARIDVRFINNLLGKSGA